MKRHVAVLAAALFAASLGVVAASSPASAAVGACPASQTAPAVSTELPTSSSMIVTGVVVAGVEAGCLILEADNGVNYLLLGGDPKVVTVGAILRINGWLRTDVASYCMQGQPLQIIRVEILG